jgi:hypothetical protein
VVGEEKTRGIVFLLYREQLRIVGASVGALPFALEEAAFRDVGARVRRHFSQFVGSLADRPRLPPPGLEIGLVVGKAGIGWGARRQR